MMTQASTFIPLYTSWQVWKRYQLLLERSRLAAVPRIRCRRQWTKPRWTALLRAQNGLEGRKAEERSERLAAGTARNLFTCARPFDLAQGRSD